MIEGVRDTSIGTGRVVARSICLQSSAESREYNMLTYFWGMGTYFYWRMEAYNYWGMGRNLWGDEYPPSPLDLHPCQVSTVNCLMMIAASCHVI